MSDRIIKNDESLSVSVDSLYKNVRDILITAREQVYSAANSAMVQAYRKEYC